MTGASGGVGSAIIQLAHLRGAEPIAIVGAGKEQAVKEVGALQAFNRADPGLFELLYEATNGGLFHVAADLVGGSLFNLCLKALRPHGRYITAGAIGGPVVQFDLRTLYLKHLELHGSSQGTVQHLGGFTVTLKREPSSHLWQVSIAYRLFTKRNGRSWQKNSLESWW